MDLDEFTQFRPCPKIVIQIKRSPLNTLDRKTHTPTLKESQKRDERGTCAPYGDRHSTERERAGDSPLYATWGETKKYRIVQEVGENKKAERLDQVQPRHCVLSLLYDCCVVCNFFFTSRRRRAVHTAASTDVRRRRGGRASKERKMMAVLGN